jgi:hypothetical protein
MPRQKSIVTIIRDLVRTEIRNALSGLFGGLGVTSPGAKPKRRRRRRRKAGAPAGTKRRGRPPGRKRKATSQSSS